MKRVAVFRVRDGEPDPPSLETLLSFDEAASWMRRQDEDLVAVECGMLDGVPDDRLILYCSPPKKPSEPPGYHVRRIRKGVLGELSKVREELEEAEDAAEQGVVLMELVELADLYGAVKARVEKLGHTVDDLAKMSAVTERAFRNGRR